VAFDLDEHEIEGVQDVTTKPSTRWSAGHSHSRRTLPSIVEERGGDLLDTLFDPSLAGPLDGRLTTRSPLEHDDRDLA